jgi:predicted transcriptional regulator
MSGWTESQLVDTAAKLRLIMADTTFTFRVEGKLKAQFSSAAKSKDRNGAQLLRDFMRDFVKQQEEAAAYDVWFRKQVARRNPTQNCFS